MPIFDEKGARTMLATWKEWLEQQAVESILPRDKVKEFIRKISSEPTASGEVVPRVQKAFDAAVARLRGLDRSAAQLLGPKLTERLVDAAGDLEPPEQAVRSFFEERAVGDLLGAVLYDGIVEFLKKANQVTDAIPGMQAAKKLAGGFGGLLGAIAGGVGDKMSGALEGQVKGFLAGFGKIAVERAVRFATSPQNQKLFREMRRNLARKALDRPVRDVLAKLTPEREAAARKATVEAVLGALEEERATHRWEAEVDRLASLHGQETIATVVKRYFGDVAPTEVVASVLAPTLARFPGSEAARAVLRDAVMRMGS